ncbi:protein kinase-like, partial [Tropilaelaps mercedesae]
VLVPIVQDIETKLAIFDKAPLIEWETALKRVGNFETRYTTKYRDEIPCAVKVSVSTGVSCEESTLRRELSLIDKVVASIVSNHPFVVRFLACFLAMAPNNTENQVADVQPPRAHITVMELVQGIDLSVFATRFRLCGRELAVHIIAQLAMAVEHFHLCGLIHRDIKLSNTMILQNARVKLIDFDVSKICIAHFSRIYSLSYFRRTPMEFRVPEKIGTAAYMAPELHLNQRFGRAIDWWSLGVVAFRLFLGRLPFRGSCEKMMEQITKQNIDWDSSTSKVPGTKDAKARSIRDFLSAILKKAPTARLGSHSYDDIFAHEIFAGFDWERLSRKDFDCPPLREFIGQGQEAQRRDEEDDNAGMDGLGIKHCKRVKPLNFCDVEDLQTSQHVKLHTFTSATIMNLIAKRDGGNDFLDEPPSMRHITNLCRKGSNEDALSGEIGQLCELEPANPETVKFVCDLKRKPVVLCRSSPVLFQQMVGFDGQPKLVVRKVISRELAVSLFEGDVIVRIAGADAAAWNSHSAEALFAVQSCIPIEVIADNAYRFSKTSSLAVDDIKARFGVLSIDFVQSDKDCWMLKKWRYGFVPRTLEFWNFKIMESRKVLVVAQFDLHRQHTAEPTSKLFFG